MDRIIESRVGNKGMGFGAELKKSKDVRAEAALKQLLPEDLVSFGLIPEFVGRLPVETHLNNLTKEDLVRVLTEPKNALIKQYKKIFEMEGVDLVFKPDALRAIATQSVSRRTGARGIRAILEATLLGVMYDIPSMPDVLKCIVTRDTIKKGIQPTLVSEGGGESLEEESA